MNTEILTGFLDANFINTGNLKAFYSFDSFSQRVIFNNLYPTGCQVISGNFFDIDSDYYPAVSIGRTSFPTSGLSTISGSGFFKSEDVLKIYKEVSTEDWTVFFNLNRPQFSSFKGSEVLFTSSPSGNYSSGLVFGINNSNKFFIEAKNSSSEKTIFSSESELGNRQVASLSKLGDNVYLSLHNKADRENKEEFFEFKNDSESYSWFFGGFQSGVSKYTGYSGYIDDLVLFSGYLDKETRDLISNVFFLTGYSPEGFYDENVESIVVTGININPTGIIGTGVTGYSSVLIDTITLDVGDPCLEKQIDIYKSIELTGYLTGEVITYLTGVDSSSGVQQVFATENRLFDYNYLKQFANKNILFTKFIDSSDTVEVYSRNVPFDNLSLNGVSDTAIHGYHLYDGYSSGNVNIYLSGKALFSGTDFSILDSTSVEIKASYFGTEDLIYDVISGEQYVSGFTGHVTPLTMTNSNFASRDLYLNGKKLISGFDYSQSASQITIALSSLNETGVLLFLPKTSGAIRHLFIEGSNFINTNFNLFDEQVWLNGLRQKRGKDYIKTPNNSLLNSDNFINSSEDPMYENENNFFNV